MTKKSQARLQKDRIAKEAEARAKALRGNSDPIWDEIDGIYRMYVAVLNTNVAFVHEMRGAKHLEPFYKEPMHVANYVQILNRDHNAMVARLEEIHEKHKDKKGVNKEHNDVTLAFGLGNEYMLLGQQIESVINPTLVQLRQFITEAETAYNLNLQTTDVNVVTDVAYVDTTPAAV